MTDLTLKFRLGRIRGSLLLGLTGLALCAGACTETGIAPPECGDGLVEGAEVCDGVSLRGETCYTRTGLSHGSLSCAPDCAAFDTSDCHTCGNGTAEGPEACDTGALRGETCATQGFDPGGTLSCDGQCALDTSGCSRCGDGQREADEACDGTDLGGVHCTDLGFGGGAVTCDSSCELDTGGCTICGDDLCQDGETAQSCPVDCACSAAEAGGVAHGYLASALVIPETSTMARSLGLDLDGDGEIDNKLGSICSLMISQGGSSIDPSAEANAAIAAGDLVIIGRLYVDSFPDDGRVFSQLLGGTLSTTPPALDGSDQATVDPATPSSSGACGGLTAGTTATADGTFHFPVPFCSITHVIFAVLPLQEAGIQGTTTAAGWTEVMVGGGLRPADINQHVYPVWATEMNDQIAADPNGSDATTALDLFDDNCETAITGCNPAPAGCAEDGVITVDELRCNALADAAFAPDVDIDGDQVNDLISLGFGLTAVPATLSP